MSLLPDPDAVESGARTTQILQMFVICKEACVEASVAARSRGDPFGCAL